MFISQLIWYARACCSYEVFIQRAAWLSCKVLGHGCVKERLKLSLRKFYAGYWDLIKHYEVFLSQMLHDVLGHYHIKWHPLFIRHFTKSWPCYWTKPIPEFHSWGIKIATFHVIFFFKMADQITAKILNDDLEEQVLYYWVCATLNFHYLRIEF